MTQFTVGDDGNPSRVVSTVFKSTQSVDDDLPPVAASQVSNDSTHEEKLYITTAQFLTTLGASHLWGPGRGMQDTPA